MNPLLMSVLRLIYPIEDSHLVRDRPLEVLALGLSRSGTESLRNALYQLGYTDVHHGFRYILETREALQWLRIAYAQETMDRSKLTAAEFDKVLGNCAAVTDQPSCGFAHQLIDAYPDAKIILNYREDVDAWHSSVANTIEKFNATWSEWLLTWFQAELFWQQRSFWWTWRRYFDGDFEKNGRKWYHEHYRSLEDRLPEGSYLKWRVEDGWEPLCRYLAKPVPAGAFPNGNTPAAYEAKMGKLLMARVAQAQRNMRVAVGVVIAFSAMSVAYVMLTR